MTAAPQAALAAAIGGQVSGPSTISVGDHVIAAYPTGGVYLLPERRKLGRWSDPTDVLAAAYRREVAA